MSLDIRTPIGLMFSVFGVILTVYGFLSDPAIYGRSLGININLVGGSGAHTACFRSQHAHARHTSRPVPEKIGEGAKPKLPRH